MKIKETREMISQIVVAVYVYETANDRLPDSIEEMLRNLYSSPHRRVHVTSSVLPFPLTDAWGTPFSYSTTQGKAFTIISAGVDGIFGTADDFADE